MDLPIVETPLNYIQIGSTGILGTHKHGSTSNRYLGIENNTESKLLTHGSFTKNKEKGTILNKLVNQDDYRLWILVRNPILAWSSGIAEALSEYQLPKVYEHLVHNTDGYLPWRGVHSLTNDEDINRVYAFMSYKHKDTVYRNNHINLFYIQTLFEFLREVSSENLTKINLLNLDTYSQDNKTIKFLQDSKVIPKHDPVRIRHTNSRFVNAFKYAFLNSKPQNPFDPILCNLIRTETLLLDFITDSYKDRFFQKAEEGVSL